MKKRFLIITVLIGLLFTCRDPFGDDDFQDSTDPNQKTVIVFDNTQGICTALVYDDYRRRDEDKIAEIPAGISSREIEWTPGTSVPFYFSYHINFKGISGFTLNYTPKEVGKDQTAVRIDANIKTNISIPKLDETLSSPDMLLSDNSFLLIQNNSSYSFQLYRGNSSVNPDGSSSPLVISGERAQYTINPGAASNYRILIGANYVTLPGSLVSFEAGRVYSFFFDGGVSLASEVEIKLENIAGVSPNKPVPQTPGTPVIIASSGLLTVSWTAVEGSEKYEVYISTMQNPPALPERTVYSSTTVLTGLTNKTTYYVWIKAVNENGSSDFSPRARGIPWPANEVPAVPGRPVIIPGINQLTVNWEETGGASSYEVYISTTTTAPSSATVTSDKTSAVINNLQNNVIYYVWVRAVNSVGKSGYSPVEAGTPKIPTIAPAAPPHPVLTAGSRELSVSWQAVELASAYEVWLGTSSDPAQAQKYSGDITGGITETIITGLVNETMYYVWIKAKNVVGTSGFSLPASAKPSAFIFLPETPTTPTVIPGNRELTVSWTAVEGALFYEVWTGATNNPANAVKYGADISSTSTRLTNLNNGTIYYIWIKSKNNIGISEFSPIASGIPSASAGPPLAPQSAPVVTSGNKGLTLSWQAEEGASAYELWAGTTPNTIMATKRGNDVSALSGTITGLTNETTYYVWIKAKNSKGTSGFSPMTSGMPSITPGLYRGVEKIGTQNLSTALSYISYNAVSGDNYLIVLGTNESASPTNLNYSGKTVEITLLGYGGERTITLASNGSMFTIGSCVTLTLDENITLMGLSTNNNALVAANPGNLVINTGAKISGNTLGGVIVSGGNITMNDGSISGNTANSGGGICFDNNGGTFTMNGGSISGNTANGYGGGIAINGNGTLIMNGGVISGNTAFYGGGIIVYNGTVIMNGGSISGNIVSTQNISLVSLGGGIYISEHGGTVTMNGGSISGNTAANGYGGGIYSNGNGTLIMNGGIISGNTATNGGGIYGGTFIKLPSGGGQNSGIIYGFEAVGNDTNGVPLRNTASSDANGHAVYFSSTKKRNTTAGQTDHIYSTTGRGLSANGNPPFEE